ncbi:uncharacterized protein L201_005007 [Kwoniella dendrophila CBS 6074]|uniref:Uncharacterized protein n=1 Tax=Kwoniella dendrophila CBS 6074 TaxID=1295534 RepID=A0AAX4JXZ7_9TREE
MSTSQSVSAEYLSATSANALISDLRPTSLSLPALLSLNSFLDELLVSLIEASQSINPNDLRKEGVPSVFIGEKGLNAQGSESTNVRALGRSAVAEAEVELRSWLEGKTNLKGFQPDGQGNGMRNSKQFDTEQAIGLMRLKCVSYSTMASQAGLDEASEEEILASWKKAGGDPSENTIEPAALWLTAIIEHVCEHILAQLASVVARDSEIVVAGPQELYTALCEDESVWGLFKKMKVKDQLEAAIRTTSRHKRSNPSRPSTSDSRGGRASPLTSGSPHASKVSLGHHRDSSFDGNRSAPSSPSNHDSRSSMETNRFGGIAGGVIRKGSQLSRKSANSPGKHHLLRGLAHERSGSVLSENTRSMLGAYNDNYAEEDLEDEQSVQEAQDEFDALVRSGETMKVSLTPSRLKNFDGGANRRRATESPNPSISGRSARSEIIIPSSFPTPPSNQPRPTANETSNQSLTASPVLQSSPGIVNRPRADSAQRRLQARAASIIVERADEDDGLNLAGRPGPKKESLLELLASEGGPEPPSPTRKGVFKGSGYERTKRTVPAVVLGTPPPPAPEPAFSSPNKIDTARSDFSPAITNNTSSPSTHTQSQLTSPQSLAPHDFSPQPTLTRSQFSSSSLNKPAERSGETVISRRDDEDDSPFSSYTRPKKKTEAQELADFFNNTPPPESSPTFGSPNQHQDTFDEPPAPATSKSNKGFRALVKKVTQSRKEGSPSLGTSASYSKLSSTTNLNIPKSESMPLNGPKITGWAGFEDPDSQPQLAAGGGMGMSKKQKSVQSLSTVPVAFRPFATQEDYANAEKNSGRKASNASRTSDSAREAAAKFNERRNSATAAFVGEGRRGSATATTPTTGSLGERRGSATTAGFNGERRGSAAAIIYNPERRGSAAAVTYNLEARRGSTVNSISEERELASLASSKERKNSEPNMNETDRRGSENRKMIGLGINEVSGIVGNNSTTPANARAPDRHTSDGPISPKQSREHLSPSLEKSRPDLAGLSIPGSATSFKTAHSAFTPGLSDIDSSFPANKQYNLNVPSPVKSVSTSTEDIIIPRRPSHETGTQTPPIKSIPSIPLDDLIPLRKLLDHATSVMECRLLLDAILSQYGVPIESPKPSHDNNGEISKEGTVNVKPEDRVTAWLLAGRDGPVGDGKQTSNSAKTNDNQNLEVVEGGDKTPTKTEPKNFRYTFGNSDQLLSPNDKQNLSTLDIPTQPPMAHQQGQHQDIFGDNENNTINTTYTTDEEDLEGEQTDNETGIIVARFTNEDLKRSTSNPIKLVRAANGGESENIV